MKTIALTLALLCTIVSLVQVEGQESKSCNPFMFKDCCFMPQLISRSVFDQCLKEVGGRSKILFEKFKGRLHKNKAAKQAAAMKATTVQTPRGKRSAGDDKTSPICMMNCVLEKQGMMKNGVVQVPEIKNIFRAKANGSWLPILDAAITKCDIELTKLKPSDIPTKPCSSKAAFLMTCIRRELTMNCPDEAKSQDYNKDAFCSKNRDLLKTCNPFYVDKSLVNKQTAAMKKNSQGKGKQGGNAGQGKKGAAAKASQNRDKKSGGIGGNSPPPSKG